MYRDVLFHNQVREGVQLLLKKESNIAVSGKEVVLKRGTVVEVKTLFVNSFSKLTVLLNLPDEVQAQLPIDYVVELFDRVVPEAELSTNGYATPYVEEEVIEDNVVSVDFTKGKMDPMPAGPVMGDEGILEIYDDEYFDALEAHNEEQATQEYINEITQKPNGTSN